MARLSVYLKAAITAFDGRNPVAFLPSFGLDIWQSGLWLILIAIESCAQYNSKLIYLSKT
jgi:hypothetical protein